MAKNLMILLLISTGVCPAQLQRGFRNAETPSSNARVALVIGNSQYGTAPLRNPVNDARAMASALSGLGFQVMERYNVNQTGMKQAIREFGQQLSQGGVGLFYYAGHGIQLQNQNFLVPVDAVIQKELDIETEGVDLKRIYNEMESANNGLNIVILDACRDNPYARSFRSMSRGLAQTRAPQGVFIAYATEPGSVAADGEGEHGLYTQELLAAMQQPGLKIEEVFKDVRRAVMKKSQNQQTPWESSSLTGDFYFKAGDRPQQPQPPIQQPILTFDKWGLRPPCYVVCASACNTETEAKRRKSLFSERGYQSGYLWIPDYASLSGAKMYLIYIGPFESREDCKYFLTEYKKSNMGAYGLLVSHQPGRVEIR